MEFYLFSFPVDNPCEGHNCSHMCLLTSGGSGYRCACPEGEGLTDNGTQCVSEYTSLMNCIHACSIVAHDKDVSM